MGELLDSSQFFPFAEGFSMGRKFQFHFKLSMQGMVLVGMVGDRANFISNSSRVKPG